MEYRVNDSSRFPTCHFILRCDDDGMYWLTNASGCEMSEAKTIPVQDSFVRQLRQIVEEEDMRGYKPHYSRWIDIKDGESWTLTIRLEDGEPSVNSSGENAYPKGNGLKRIHQLCLDTWNENQSSYMP